MSEETRESTIVSANERPPDGQCLICAKTTVPYLRPAFCGLEERWLESPSVCEVCEKKQEAQAKVLREQALLDEAMKSSRLSLRFRQKSFENFKPEAHTHKAFEAALRFEPKDEGLLLLGPCGVGKTHLAAAIANRQIGTVTTLFLSCPEFLLEMREGINGRKKSQYHLFDLARQVKLLVLDDIGAERSSEWVQETLFVLLNYRYEELLPTIFTTNCSLDELEAKLGERISSRIVEMSRCIRIQGEDWRLKSRIQSLEECHD